MRFDKQHINADSDASAGERRNKLRRAAARVGRGQTIDANRMRRIKHHRIAQLAHRHQRAHIDDQIMIAKTRAALGENDFVVAGVLNFFNDIFHIFRIEELAFFNIHNSAGFCDRQSKRRLHAQIRRNLNDVQHLSAGFRVVHIMNIRQHRNVEFLFDAPQHRQTLFHTGALIAFFGRTVVL